MIKITTLQLFACAHQSSSKSTSVQTHRIYVVTDRELGQTTITSSLISTKSKSLQGTTLLQIWILLQDF